MKVSFDNTLIIASAFSFMICIATVLGYFQTLITFGNAVNEIFFAVGSFTLGFLTLMGSIKIMKN